MIPTSDSNTIVLTSALIIFTKDELEQYYIGKNIPDHLKKKEELVFYSGTEVTKHPDGVIYITHKKDDRVITTPYHESIDKILFDVVNNKVTEHQIKQLMPIIKLDFDGTVVTEAFPNIGEPIPMALETIKKLNQHGYNLILWTCRENEHLDAAVDFFKKHGIHFDAVNSGHHNNPYRHLPPSRKPFAHYHIDDKNIGGLPDWQRIHDHFFVEKRYHETLRNKI